MVSLRQALRRLVAALLVALWSHAALAAWSGTDLGHAQNLSITVTATASVGSLVVVAIYEDASIADPANGGTVADSKNNCSGYSSRGSAPLNGNSAVSGVAVLYDCVLTSALSSGVDTITYTPASAGNGFNVVAAVWTGNASTPFDKVHTNFGTGTAPTDTTLAPAQSGELFVAIAVGAGTSTNETGATQPSGWATPMTAFNDIFSGSLVEPGTSTHTFNPGNWTSSDWAVLIIMYKASATTTPLRNLLGVGP